MKKIKDVDNDRVLLVSIKDMNTSAYVLITLILCLTIVPPLFSNKKGFFNELYWDDVYYSILYTFIAFLLIVGPFFVNTTHWFMRYLSFLLGAWYVAGVIYILQNFGKEDDKMIDKDTTMYFRYLFVFIICITLITLNRLWIKLQQ